MNRSIIVKIIDLLSFGALTLMVSTGVLVEFTLPPGSGGDHVWGLTRHDWGNIHFYLSLAFLLLITSHLITHIKFIKMVMTGKASAEKNYRIAFGVLGLIALITLALAPITSPVTEVQKGQQFYYHNR